MACGVPVLGTAEAFSGIQVEHGINCIIAEREKFGKAICDILDGKYDLAQIACLARKLVEQSFSIETVMTAWAETLHKLKDNGN
jgi:glycosyltransferase involved in cell wall biosynthesis